MKKNYTLSPTSKLVSLLVFTFFCGSLNSQNVGVNATGTTPNSSAILDLNTGNTFTSPNGKGLIIPNVALTSTTDAVTVNTPFTSLLVYNTATASSGSTAVSPGYYYWDGTKWVTFTGANGKDWALLGNAGTAVATNFLGTTDNVDLAFRANNVRSGLIDIANFQTFFGYNAGLNTTAAGILNSFVGYGAGQTNTSGTGNTAMGYNALLSNSTGIDNTAYGVQALNFNTGSNNIAFGTNAGYSISSGSGNTALGFWAINNGSNTTTGTNNTAVGIYSSQFVTGGGFNTSAGYGALRNNAAGSSNTGVGTDALYFFGSSHNTGVGTFALEGSSTVASNTGVANSALGYAAGSGNTGAPGSGGNNNLPITSGSYNTFLGFASVLAAGTYSNSTSVGSWAQAGQSDAVILGSIAGVNGATNSVKVGIGTTTPSDALHVVVPSGSTINAITADVTAGNSASNAIYAVSTGIPNYSAIYTVSSPTVAGTGFSTTLSNHTLYANINNNQAYSFGLYGRIAGSGVPSGGVMGYWASTLWGALGYYSTASAKYGAYVNATAVGATTYGNGAGRGSDPSTLPVVMEAVGLGAYGDLFGSWIRGNVYGMAVKGERTSLYVDGKTIVNQPIVELSRTDDDKTIVNYNSVSSTPDLQLHGSAQMNQGKAVVQLDASQLSQFDAKTDLTIIATPGGQTNGVYAELKGDKLIIQENNNGTANVKVSWIIIGQRNIAEDFVPTEFKEKDFDGNLREFMHNENDTNIPQNIWWDGAKLNKGNVPKLPKQ